MYIRMHFETKKVAQMVICKEVGVGGEATVLQYCIKGAQYLLSLKTHTSFTRINDLTLFYTAPIIITQ